MILTIKGGNKKNQQIIKEVTEWILPKILSDKELSRVNFLKFTIKAKFQNATDEGLCLWLDKGVKPREFEVVLSSKMNEKQLSMVIMHELTHLGQYVKGHLKHKITDNNFYWNDEKVDIDIVPYWELPWENEAIFNEVLLYTEWKEFKNIL